MCILNTIELCTRATLKHLKPKWTYRIMVDISLNSIYFKIDATTYHVHTKNEYKTRKELRL